MMSTLKTKQMGSETKNHGQIYIKIIDFGRSQLWDFKDIMLLHDIKHHFIYSIWFISLHTNYLLCQKY